MREKVLTNAGVQKKWEDWLVCSRCFAKLDQLEGALRGLCDFDPRSDEAIEEFQGFIDVYFYSWGVAEGGDGLGSLDALSLDVSARCLRDIDAMPKEQVSLWLSLIRWIRGADRMPLPHIMREELECVANGIPWEEEEKVQG